MKDQRKKAIALDTNLIYPAPNASKSSRQLTKPINIKMSIIMMVKEHNKNHMLYTILKLID